MQILFQRMDSSNELYFMHYFGWRFSLLFSLLIFRHARAIPQAAQQQHERAHRDDQRIVYCKGWLELSGAEEIGWLLRDHQPD
jgi:hypothetical protein